MKKIDDAIERFKELKESGKNISLGDILNNYALKGETKGVISNFGGTL
jgi:hypothetical protein